MFNKNHIRCLKKRRRNKKMKSSHLLICLYSECTHVYIRWLFLFCASFFCYWLNQYVSEEEQKNALSLLSYSFFVLLMSVLTKLVSSLFFSSIDIADYAYSLTSLFFLWTCGGHHSLPFFFFLLFSRITFFNTFRSKNL